MLTGQSLFVAIHCVVHLLDLRTKSLDFLLIAVVVVCVGSSETIQSVLDVISTYGYSVVKNADCQISANKGRE